jgi:hypothetical protein
MLAPVRLTAQEQSGKPDRKKCDSLCFWQTRFQTRFPVMMVNLLKTQHRTAEYFHLKILLHPIDDPVGATLLADFGGNGPAVWVPIERDADHAPGRPLPTKFQHDANLTQLLVCCDGLYRRPAGVPVMRSINGGVRPSSRDWLNTLRIWGKDAVGNRSHPDVAQYLKAESQVRSPLPITLVAGRLLEKVESRMVLSIGPHRKEAH